MNGTRFALSIVLALSVLGSAACQASPTSQPTIAATRTPVPTPAYTATPAPQAVNAESLRTAVLRLPVAEEQGIDSLTLPRGAFRQPIPNSSAEVRVDLVNSTLGDLNDDDVGDAAVVYATSTGGSGTFMELAALVATSGPPDHVATAYLGDGVRVESLYVDAGDIVVSLLTHGPSDPLCCPKQPLTVRYYLSGDELVERSSVKVPDVSEPGPSLAGTTWILLGYGVASDPKPPPADAQVTLTVDADGNVSGLAGCNRYFASIIILGSSMHIGPIGTTKVACSPELMDLEGRFTTLLQGATSFEVRDGQLVIIGEDDQVLLFQTKEASVSWVTISSPEEGARVASAGPIQVSGEGESLFENNVVVRVLDDKGNELVLKPTIMPTEELGGRGTWRIDLEVAKTPGAKLTIEAYSTSPRDGSVVAFDSVTVVVASE